MEQALLSFRSLTLDEDPPANVLSLANRHSIPSTCKIKNHKLIGKFAITKNEKYSTSEKYCKIPERISSKRIKELQLTDLNVGYKSPNPIEDYNSYRQKIQKYFRKWLQDTDYFQRVKEGKYKKPDFICFGGCISGCLQTPLKSNPAFSGAGGWEIHGGKFMDTIFLWNESPCGSRTRLSSYGVTFEALLTGKNPARVNEREKIFVIQEVEFGNHQLLVLNEIDAVDQDEWTEIKISGECSPAALNAKCLKYWAQSVVPGVSKIIVGQRSDDGVLEKTKKFSLDEILLGISVGDINECYDFQDRLLKWISEHFKNEDSEIVKKFTWDPSSSKPEVKCTESVKDSKNSMLPKLFCSECKLFDELYELLKISD